MLKQLPEKLKEPIAIFTSASHPNTSIIALVELAYKGKHIIAPVEIDGFGQQNGVRIDSNAIKSAHTRGNAISGLFRDAIKKESVGKVGVYYYDKTKATGILNTSELQLLGLKSDANGYIHSIRETGSPVKPKIANITETKQFKRWFGKSQAVNADGTPKVFYHGTPNGTLPVFKTQHSERGKTRHGGRQTAAHAGLFPAPRRSEARLRIEGGAVEDRRGGRTVGGQIAALFHRLQELVRARKQAGPVEP